MPHNEKGGHDLDWAVNDTPGVRLVELRGDFALRSRGVDELVPLHDAGVLLGMRWHHQGGGGRHRIAAGIVRDERVLDRA